MRKHKGLFFIVLGAFVLLSGSCEKEKKDHFAFDKTQLKDQYYATESIPLAVLNANSKKIDSIIYYFDDKNIASQKGLEKATFGLNGQKLGYHNIKAMVYSEGSATSDEITTRIEVVTEVQPKLFKYTVVNTYPHDEKAFTEGLEFFRDTLMESTGQKGASFFRKIDYKTGFVYKQINLDSQYFGEGITVINNQIFQLTYQENTGFIYNANTLKLEKTFQYDKKIEGWGMTNDGTHIYSSDGTEKIWVMDPATQKMVDYINVYTGSDKVKSINELEWIDGKIFGNIWQKDAVAIINPLTGAVDGVLDLSALRKQVKSVNAEVLNGIAYNPKTKTIFVTGKYWDKLFEIKVSE